MEANGSGLCNYNTLIGAAEEFFGSVLTRDQKDALLTGLQSMEGLKDGERPSVDIAESDYGHGYVHRPDDVFQAVLDALEKGETWSMLIHNTRPVNVSDDNLLTVRRWLRPDGNLKHANLGDAQGNFLWESLIYSDTGAIRTGDWEALRYIEFRLK